MWPNPQETVDLITFTIEILNGNLHVVCSVIVPQKLIESINFFKKEPNKKPSGTPLFITA